MVRRVNVTVQAGDAVVQAICQNNLITGNFRVGRSGANVVNLTGFFVGNLVGVLFHGLISGLLARALLHWLGIDCNKVYYSQSVT